MIAVIALSGHQYIVKEKSIIEVDHQDLEVGNTLTVEPLLLADSTGENARVGTPTISEGKVTLTVLDHFRGEKIRVFKMKSKKHYRKTQGFRAERTRLQVTSIL